MGSPGDTPEMQGGGLYLKKIHINITTLIYISHIHGHDALELPACIGQTILSQIVPLPVPRHHLVVAVLEPLSQQSQLSLLPFVLDIPLCTKVARGAFSIFFFSSSYWKIKVFPASFLCFSTPNAFSYDFIFYNCYSYNSRSAAVDKDRLF